MVLSARIARRAVAGAIGAGAIAGAMLFGAIGSALAQPEPAPAPAPPPPPNCTAADLAGVSAGVDAATSAYLFTHPDVNAFFSGLGGQHRHELQDDLDAYFAEHPQVKDELTAIRQPLVDIKHRCGSVPAPELP
ncbi:heme-binding protein [uncultured Mycolicibacterium sp.]|uniref:heme-binding protein n=1 Tax=uncultured Mycolicibacterium sp. TaxID=2320817 RepID=UPI002615E3C6|nr:heme-binding protein [uncultured Mycolicibacterium sp.]